MCRLLAYVGPPVTLHDLLLAPPHSLLRQSWEPRHQRHGAVNADGFGVGWYDHDRRPEPARYRRARPIWTDRSFASLAGVVASTAVLAAVRNATPPAPVEESGAAPFTSGPWLFAHNGAVEGFAGPSGCGVQLRAAVSPGRLAEIEGAADSEVLFAMVLGGMDTGLSPAAAMQLVVAGVASMAPGSRLNLALTDGRRVVATAFGDSLFVRRAGGVVVASEPFDDEPGWEHVPDRSLVEATAESVSIAEGVL
ncbi:MAG TPA: ergothioneine biosynthesis protein EgtC [Acidimicrobiales bacterium]|nr:ergothioneine biosynthesis protein EgtC [Acidimicrobiales bacterium]